MIPLINMVDKYGANSYHYGYNDNEHYGNGAGGATYFRVNGTSCGSGAGGGFADGHGNGYDNIYYHDYIFNNNTRRR